MAIRRSNRCVSIDHGSCVDDGGGTVTHDADNGAPHRCWHRCSQSGPADCCPGQSHVLRRRELWADTHAPSAIWREAARSHVTQLGIVGGRECDCTRTAVQPSRTGSRETGGIGDGSQLFCVTKLYGNVQKHIWDGTLINQRVGCATIGTRAHTRAVCQLLLLIDAMCGVDVVSQCRSK